MRDIIFKNEQLEDQLNELKSIVTDVANERSTTKFYELLRFLPITNMFVNVYGKFRRSCFFSYSFCLHLETAQREKLEKRINKFLEN